MPTPVLDPARVVVVDDDATLLGIVTRVLRAAGHEVRAHPDAESALADVDAEDGKLDAILTDLYLPGTTGMDLLARIRERWADIPVVMMTGNATIETAVEAMRLGAYNYLLKPFSSPDEVVLTLSRAIEHARLVDRNRRLERRLDVTERFEEIVGASSRMREVFALIESVAPTDATVLVLGESGTGKELVARAIHKRSQRRDKAFVPVNCSALAETLLESELFGYVKGAFSGASSDRRGLFEEASGGTLFLDEVGDISHATQVKLLRVLQESEIKPVGATTVRKVDVRVVAATNRDLRKAIRDGAFREDLFFRLNVLPIELPPLRERRGDIAMLVQHFVAKYAERFRKSVRGVDPAALDVLVANDWPGNIRELENTIQRAVLLAHGEVIGRAALPREVLPAGPELPVVHTGASARAFADARASALAAFERGYLDELLVAHHGNLARAAKQAGLDRSNLRRLLRRHEIDPGRYRVGPDEDDDDD
jgi:two-component system response regulator HydG